MSIGFCDQALEDRIAEDLPPLSSVRVRPLLASLLESRAGPVFGPGFMLWLEVRPQMYAAAEAECANQQYLTRTIGGRHWL